MPGALPHGRHDARHSLPHIWSVHTPEVWSTWTSRCVEERKASPVLSTGCRAPAFALLAEVRTEWAPLCCFHSSSHQAEPETGGEEKDGGRKGKPPLERGQQPRHCLPLDSLGAGSTRPAKPMWGLHSLFPGLCIPFPGCISHRSYRGAGEKGEILPELQW